MKVSDKAKESCKNASHDINDHFADVSKMVELGSGTERQIDDIMLTTKESKIVTVADVKEFFNHLVNERQVVFHPDDPFEDYKFEGGKGVFTQDEYAVYNRLMNNSFEACEKNRTDIYALGLELMQSL